MNNWIGKNNPRWNGGKCADRGYVLVKEAGHPFADNRGYVREHRLIMEKHVGRLLTEYELVHHINGDKKDNRIENLEIVTRSVHKIIHAETGAATRFKKGNIPPVINGHYKECPKCKKQFWITPSMEKHGNKYCSKECQKNQVILSCPVCEKTFTRKQSVIKLSMRNFCSVDCRRSYYAKKH